jgi:hypothetical protein
MAWSGWSTVSATPELAPLCTPCMAEMGRWLDTSPSTLIPRLGFAYGSGAAYDASPSGVTERRRARHAEWAATVRHQRALVAAGCRTGQHAPELYSNTA